MNTDQLNNPEEYWPGNFDTPERANALLLCLCQKAAVEIENLRDKLECFQSNLSASAQAIVQLEAIAAEAHRNDAIAMGWISEAKQAIGYEGDMPGFIGVLHELNERQ